MPALLLLLMLDGVPLLEDARVTWVSAGELTRGVCAFALDITGDGRAELFVTVPEAFGKAGATWVVYQQAEPPTDRYRRLGQLFLHPGAYRFDKARGRVVAYVRYGAEDGVVESYQVHPQRFERATERSCEAGSCEDERALIAQWLEQAPQVLCSEWPKDGHALLWRDSRTDQPVGDGPALERLWVARR